MVGKRTRSASSTHFGGPPSPLNKTEPPTFRQIIQYSYFLKNTCSNLTNFDISKLMAKNIIDIWNAVNPRLPLLSERSIIIKLKRTCFEKAHQINRKSISSAQKKIMVKKLDTLFDISSCSCQLPILSCEDKNVKCKKENCQTRHIICICPLKDKVKLFFYFSFLMNSNIIPIS